MGKLNKNELRSDLARTAPVRNSDGLVLHLCYFYCIIEIRVRVRTHCIHKKYIPGIPVFLRIIFGSDHHVAPCLS